MSCKVLIEENVVIEAESKRMQSAGSRENSNCREDSRVHQIGIRDSTGPDLPHKPQPTENDWLLRHQRTKPN